MRNVEVIKRFINGSDKGSGSNLRVVGNELINYETVIAIRCGRWIILNNESYSPTTAKNQYAVRRNTECIIECPEDLFGELLDTPEKLRDMNELAEMLNERIGASRISLMK